MPQTISSEQMSELIFSAKAVISAGCCIVTLKQSDGFYTSAQYRQDESGEWIRIN